MKEQHLPSKLSSNSSTDQNIRFMEPLSSVHPPMIQSEAHFDLHQISVFIKKNQVPPASENPPPSPGSCHGNHPGQFAALTQLPLSTDQPRRTESDIWNGAAVDFLASTVGSVVQPRAAVETASLTRQQSPSAGRQKDIFSP